MFVGEYVSLVRMEESRFACSYGTTPDDDCSLLASRPSNPLLSGLDTLSLQLGMCLVRPSRSAGVSTSGAARRVLMGMSTPVALGLGLLSCDHWIRTSAEKLLGSM